MKPPTTILLSAIFLFSFHSLVGQDTLWSKTFPSTINSSIPPYDTSFLSRCFKNNTLLFLPDTIQTKTDTILPIVCRYTPDNQDFFYVITALLSALPPEKGTGFDANDYLRFSYRTQSSVFQSMWFSYKNRGDMSNESLAADMNRDGNGEGPALSCKPQRVSIVLSEKIPEELIISSHLNGTGEAIALSGLWLTAHTKYPSPEIISTPKFATTFINEEITVKVHTFKGLPPFTSQWLINKHLINSVDDSCLNISFSKTGIQIVKLILYDAFGKEHLFNAAEINVIEEPAPLLSSDFKKHTILPWKTYNSSGDSTFNLVKTGSNYHLQINGYASTQPHDVWLISPPLSVDSIAELWLTFNHTIQYQGPLPQIMYTTEYKEGDPTHYQWYDVSPSSISNRRKIAWFKVCSKPHNQLHIAFRYISGTAKNEALQWNIYSITIGTKTTH